MSAVGEGSASPARLPLLPAATLPPREVKSSVEIVVDWTSVNTSDKSLERLLRGISKPANYVHPLAQPTRAQITLRQSRGINSLEACRCESKRIETRDTP